MLNYCKDCGKEIDGRSIRCCRCNNLFSPPMKGKRHTKKANEANRLAHLGNHPSAETIAKRARACRKPRKTVWCVDCGLAKEIIVNSREKHGRWRWEGRCGRCVRVKNAKRIGHRNKGANHGMWQGGIAKGPYSQKWTRQLRDRVRVRDNFVCQVCGVQEILLTRRLDIHHITYNKKDCQMLHLISLCPSCHMKTNKDRKYWEFYFLNRKRK